MRALNINKMKKTKTGLHIQTRKNRIEVYTQKELEAKELKKELQRERIIQGAIIFMLALCVAFGYLIGSES
jgi:hypothetical protein